MLTTPYGDPPYDGLPTFAPVSLTVTTTYGTSDGTHDNGTISFPLITFYPTTWFTPEQPLDGYPAYPGYPGYPSYPQTQPLVPCTPPSFVPYPVQPPLPTFSPDKLKEIQKLIEAAGGLVPPAVASPIEETPKAPEKEAESPIRAPGRKLDLDFDE